MDAIKIENLTKQYKDVTAVDRLNLTIQEGELFSLLGVNGAGKTTTIKMLSCLTAPTSGDATVLGESVTKNPAAVKASIGVSPQETAVAAGLTVRENLELICGIYGFSKQKTAEKVSSLSAMLSLEDVLNKKASKLSGGYARRLSIAMALISEPKVLFLDEPTLGLDVIARKELWSVIEAMRGEVTVILTTHYMEEAEKLSDRVAVMSSGKLRAMGTPQEIIKQSGKDNFEDAFVNLATGGEL